MKEGERARETKKERKNGGKRQKEEREIGRD